MKSFIAFSDNKEAPNYITKFIATVGLHHLIYCWKQSPPSIQKLTEIEGIPERLKNGLELMKGNDKFLEKLRKVKCSIDEIGYLILHHHYFYQVLPDPVIVRHLNKRSNRKLVVKKLRGLPLLFDEWLSVGDYYRLNASWNVPLKNHMAYRKIKDNLDKFVELKPEINTMIQLLDQPYHLYKNQRRGRRGNYVFNNLVIYLRDFIARKNPNSNRTHGCALIFQIISMLYDEEFTQANIKRLLSKTEIKKSFEPQEDVVGIAFKRYPSDRQRLQRAKYIIGRISNRGHMVFCPGKKTTIVKCEPWFKK